KIAGKPGDDRKHWKGQAEEQIRRKRVHEKYKDEFKTRAEAAEQRAERFRCALTEVQALTEHGPCGEGADEDPGDNVIRVRINDIIRDALEPTDG
ncbi:MAG: hypothetical protein GY719_23115, partial [bacterium]|nr:hypothetical protein [bacterium]